MADSMMTSSTASISLQMDMISGRYARAIQGSSVQVLVAPEYTEQPTQQEYDDYRQKSIEYEAWRYRLGHVQSYLQQWPDTQLSAQYRVWEKELLEAAPTKPTPPQPVVHAAVYQSPSAPAGMMALQSIWVAMKKKTLLSKTGQMQELSQRLQLLKAAREVLSSKANTFAPTDTSNTATLGGGKDAKGKVALWGSEQEIAINQALQAARITLPTKSSGVGTIAITSSTYEGEKFGVQNPDATGTISYIGGVNSTWTRLDVKEALSYIDSLISSNQSQLDQLTTESADDNEKITSAVSALTNSQDGTNQVLASVFRFNH